MKNFVICKACGYVTEEGKLGDKCPACGVGRQAFEPYQSKVSASREFILRLDLHTVMVHFPQAFTYSIPFLLLMAAPDTGARPILLDAARALAVLLPLVVIFAIITGIIDGQTRFKKLGTPLLSKKLLLGGTYLVVSVALSWLALSTGFSHLILAGVLLLAAMGCSAYLGLIGSRLVCLRLPG